MSYKIFIFDKRFLFTVYLSIIKTDLAAQSNCTWVYQRTLDSIWKKIRISTDKKALQVSKKELEPGQNIMIAHMTTQVERRMKEWKKDKKKAKASQG